MSIHLHLQTMRRIIFISPCCCFLLGISLSVICCNALLPLHSSKRFSTPGWSNNDNKRKRSTVVSITITGTEGQTDLTQTDYVLEPIPIRIGHGFDIHRMAPIEEAGQPLIIAGVVVEHSNQKWLDVEGKYVSKGNVYETQLGVVAHSDGTLRKFFSTKDLFPTSLFVSNAPVFFSPRL